MNSFRRQIRSKVLAFLWFGALRRYRIDKPVVIAIGGSVGKTSTKEAVALLLETAELQVRKTQGNMATDFGVALSLLGCTDTPANMGAWLGVAWRVIAPYRKQADYYVLEYSSDMNGDTAFLTQKIPPHIAILSTLVPVHMEQYGDIASMVEETVSLIDALPADGVIIANSDDAYQQKALSPKRKGSRLLLWYGTAKKEAPTKQGIWAHGIAMGKNGLEGTITLMAAGGVDGLNSRGKSIPIRTQVLGEYQLYPLLAATGVAQVLQLPFTVIKETANRYHLPSGRGRLIEGRNGMTIIDDSANASPEAVKAGLGLLKPFAGNRRSVAILGTMNELGETSKEAHIDVAEAAAKQATSLIAIGKYAPLMVEAAKKAGMPSEHVTGFANPEQLMGHINQLVQRNDVIYIKASQDGMRLERVVKTLMAKPNQAAELLVRQGAYWQTH